MGIFLTRYLENFKTAIHPRKENGMIISSANYLDHISNYLKNGYIFKVSHHRYHSFQTNFDIY
jgi:hypothetical protein